MLHADPVCAEPKLFVGGLRFEATRDDVVARFQLYGPIKSCVLLTHKDSGKSKGCAMVLFHKWAHAEAAVTQDNGAVSDLSGATRPLIVKFADPQRRPEDGVLIGVTPKKLFIGQIPSGITQEQIRSICAPYGDIVDCNVMPPKRDNAMGCAFVTHATWAAAESAAEALNGTFTFPGAAAPIAVKLADAKPSDMQKIGAKRGMMDMMGGGMGGGGMGGGGAKRQMMGGGMRGMMGGYGGMGMGMSPMMMGMGMPGMMGQGMGMMNPGQQGMMGMMGPMGMMGQGQAGGNMGQAGAMGQGQPGAIGPAGPPGMEGAAGGAAAMGQEGVGQPGQPGGMAGGMSGAMGGYGQQGMNMNMPMGYGGMGGMGMGGMGGYGGMGGMGMGMGGMGMGGMGGMGMGGMGMGGMKSGAQGLGIGNQNGNLQAAKAWKLFIGQISFDLAEPDLFAFFSQFGTILELVLLRNPGDGGRHRGCGFLVYNSAQEAEAALQADQATLPNDARQRKISVRYANQKGA